LEDRTNAAKQSLKKGSIEAAAAQPPLLVARESAGDPLPVDDALVGQEAFAQRALLNRVGSRAAEVVNVQMLRDGQYRTEFDFNDEVVVRVVIRVDEPLTRLNVSLKIRTLQGSDLVFLDTRLLNQMDRVYQAARFYCFDWKLRVPMMHGHYALACGLAHPPEVPGDDWQFVDVIPHAYEFSIGARPGGMIDGFVTLPAELQVRCMTDERGIASAAATA
jgi:hypothetical protein